MSAVRHHAGPRSPRRQWRRHQPRRHQAAT